LNLHPQILTPTPSLSSNHPASAVALHCLALLILLAVPFHLRAATPDSPSISHSPLRPRSHRPVAITAQLPGSDSATLQVQVVEPGSYIRRTDPAFEKSWREFPMEKHGASFIASIPASLQQHRHLVRYRIRAQSPDSRPAFFPPQSSNSLPNFAYFVYDGFPPFIGASRPGRSPQKTFPPDFLATLPTYHLIANSTDVRNSQWNPNSNRRPFLGSLVYDGHVYDHITFHNRGQASTYVSGKNKWGFKFNPAEPFAAKNFWDEPYKFKWNSFNLNPCASAWAQVNRGMAGMDEALSYRAYQLAGVPSPDSFWIHFRVIDSPSESATDQFNTDLWGLYLVVQDKNGNFLRENNLPDGDIYSIDSGPKHLASPSTRSSSERRSRSSSPPTEDAWRASLDLPSYYSFHALNRYLANIDLRPDGNHYLYYRPDGRLVILPHDLDMMLIPKHHQPGYVPQSRCLDFPALKIEYQARARELLDLLASDPSPNGGQIGQLVAELSGRLQPIGHQLNWAELDEAMWNWHPRSQHPGQFNITPYQDHRFGGQWTRHLSSSDFDGFCKYILDFCTDSRPRKNFRPNDGNQLGYGYGYLAYEARDSEIPERPKIQFTGSGKFDAKNLTFTVSPFSSPASHKPAALQWRLAEISAPGLPGYSPGQPFRYEIQSSWLSPESSPSKSDLQLPSNIISPGKTYRVRARYKDLTGRWSHWSSPVQFTPSL
jgi:hypothetical protein